MRLKLLRAVMSAAMTAAMAATFAWLLVPAVAMARPVMPGTAASAAPLYDDRIVVVTDAGVTSQELSATLSEHGAKAEKRGRAARSWVVHSETGRDPRKLAETISKEPGVKYAEPDYLVEASWVPNDPSYSLQWGLPMIGAPSAWDVARGAGVLVAVVDTGADLAHPDLSSKLDTTLDRNFVEPGSPAQDDNGHGTHVSGIIAAATNNSVGVAGVAPSARILPVKALDRAGDGAMIDVGDAVRYAADSGASVINMSFASDVSSQYLADAIQYAYTKDAVLVGAAGNEYATALGFPADWYGVLGVGAVATDKSRASYSNRGAGLDLVGPGGLPSPSTSGVFSTYPGGYAYLAGTSMATPHVAGAAALVRGYRPTWPAGYVGYALASTAEDLGAAGWDDEYGHGLIRPALALNASIPGDGLEPDNVPAEASALSAGAPRPHTYLPVGERDYTVLQAVPGGRYRVWTNGLSSGTDTYLEVRNAAGVVLASSDDVSAPSDLSSSVEFTAPASGDTYILSIDLWESGGSYSLEAEVLDVAPTSVSVPSVSEPAVAYGGSSTVSATVYDSSMAPLSVAATAKLQQSYDGAAWSDVRTLSTTTGTFSASVNTYRNTYYRIVFLGDASYAGSFSPAARITARVWITRPYAPASVRAGKRFSLTGYLKPRHRAGSYPVHVQAYRVSGGVWTLRMNYYAVASNYSSYTRYTDSLVLHSKGSWKMRGHHKTDGANDETYSAWEYLKVY